MFFALVCVGCSLCCVKDGETEEERGDTTRGARAKESARSQLECGFTSPFTNTRRAYSLTHTLVEVGKSVSLDLPPPCCSSRWVRFHDFSRRINFVLLGSKGGMESGSVCGLGNFTLRFTFTFSLSLWFFGSSSSTYYLALSYRRVQSSCLVTSALPDSLKFDVSLRDTLRDRH